VASRIPHFTSSIAEATQPAIATKRWRSRNRAALSPSLRPPFTRSGYTKVLGGDPLRQRLKTLRTTPLYLGAMSARAARA
jgi:hypothetical protein